MDLGEVTMISCDGRVVTTWTRVLEKLGLRPGQQVDEATYVKVVDANYAALEAKFNRDEGK